MTSSDRPVFALPAGQVVPTLSQVVEYKKVVATWEAEQIRQAREAYIKASRSTAEALYAEVGQKILREVNGNHRVANISMDWLLEAKYYERKLSVYLNPGQYCPGIAEDQTLLLVFRSLLAQTKMSYSVTNSGTGLHLTLDLSPSGL